MPLCLPPYSPFLLQLPLSVKPTTDGCTAAFFCS
jgi:hypothetical protein